MITKYESKGGERVSILAKLVVVVIPTVIGIILESVVGDE
jgi:high-affinity K+ transport system ATPase subunit B